MQSPLSPVSTLLARLRQALSDSEAERPAPASAPPPAPERSGDFRIADRPTFERRLHETLQTHGPAIGGRVQLLNLSVLADRYGARWPQVSEKIDQLAEIAVRRRIGPRDYFTKCDNGIYVIVFEGIPESEAKLKCALLAEEIMGRLIGSDPGPDEIQVASAAARVDGTIELRPFNKLDALEELLAASPPYVARPPVQGAGAAARMEAIGELARVAGRDMLDRDSLPEGQRRADSPERTARIDRLLPLLREAEAFLKSPASLYQGDPLLSDFGPQPVRATPEAEGSQSLLTVMSDLIDRAETELKLPPPAALPDPASDTGDILFRYMPCWNAGRKMVFAYHAAAGLDRGGGRLLLGQDMLPNDPPGPLLAAYDRLVLRKALADIQDCLAAQRRAMVIIPVHHATLIRQMSRAEYAAMLEAVDPDMRRCIVWEIVRPVIGLSNSNLPPAMALLKPHGRVILVDLPAEYAHFGDVAALGVHAVGFDAARLDLRERDLTRQLALFRARAERYGLRAYVRGIRSPALVAAAASDGYDYIDGPAILSPVETPGPFRELELAEIYARSYVREAGVRIAGDPT